MTISKHLPRLLIYAMLLIVAVSAAWRADQVTEDRLKALREAASGIGGAAAQPEIIVAQVCSTPDGKFSPVGVASEVPYGTRGLAAQFSGSAPGPGGALEVVWRKDKEPKPVNTGPATAGQGQQTYSQGFARSNAPLAPGVYHVKFIYADRTVAYGRTRILPPEKLGRRRAKDVYLQALGLVSKALAEIDASRAQAAAASAAKALPSLRTAVSAMPGDANAVAVHELAQAIIGIGKMDALAPRNVPDKVRDWAKRTHAHARVAERLAKDANLKKTANEIANALEDNSLGN